MPCIGIIPARLASTRLPGKVLLARTGKPLIQHVWENARTIPGLDRLAIATDDLSVRDACEAFGARVVMTRDDHPNGTSRLAEAASLLGLQPGTIVVNIQGDEPELEPSLVTSAIDALRSTRASVATVAVPITSEADAANPAIVKVVARRDGTALYFSRSRIPYPRNPAALLPLRHVGVYVYDAGFLRTYASLTPTPLEQSESLEQLRVLEHGYAIALAIMPPGTASPAGIDTPEQYEAFVRRTLDRNDADPRRL